MYFSTLPKSKARRNETHGLVRGEFEDNYQIRTRTSSLHLLSPDDPVTLACMNICWPKHKDGAATPSSWE
jgi:hypothetical protein